MEGKKIVGVALDLSLGSIQLVKNELIKLVVSFGMDGVVYVASKRNPLPRTQGESVYQVASFDGEFSVDSVRRVLEVVGGAEDADKYVFVITDRFSEKSKYTYQKATLLNESKQHGCRIVYLGIGSRYDRPLLESLGESAHCDADGIFAEISRIIGGV